MSELIQSSENLESGHKPIESANFDQDFTLTYSEDVDKKAKLTIENILKSRNEKILGLQKKAIECYEQEDYEMALAEYNKILFFEDNIPEIYAIKGEIYLKLCDFSSSIQNYKKALHLKYKEEWQDKLGELYFLKGLSMIDAGYCSDAIQFIKNLKIEDFKFVYLRALAYIRAGNKHLALSELGKCLNVDQYNIEALVLKGKLLWSMGKVIEGNQQFWVAHSVNPEHPEVKEFLQIIKPKAEDCYEKALQYTLEGNHTGALLSIKKGLEIYHDMSKLLLLRASIMRKQKQYENAIDDLELASKFMELEGIENDVKIQIGLTYNDMGQVLFAKRKYDGAISVFNEAIKYLPNDPGIHVNRGDAYRELGKYNLALADYHSALDLFGDYSMVGARLSMAHYSLGAICFNEKDYEGSAVEFSRAIQYNDLVPQYFVARAKSYMQTGNMGGAMHDFEEALARDPSNEYAASFLPQLHASLPSS